MAHLDLDSVRRRVRDLGGKREYNRDFIFELLTAYGRSKSSITRLKRGSLNVAVTPETEVAQKGIVYFKPTSEDLHTTMDDLTHSRTVESLSTRFLIVTDYDQLLALDRVTDETLDIPIAEIGKHFDFFLPWAGMEKVQHFAEAHTDTKAAEWMGRLFDELVIVNQIPGVSRGSLNLFFTRLLFCFFAEDTGILPKGLFTRKIETLTQEDGSDLQEFLTSVFAALDTEHEADRPDYLREFPYVNGGLFAAGDEVVPVFNQAARDLLLQSGRLQWDEINPDIFGSMFQAVADPSLRADLGQHYTSVPNILKTIKPLFLDYLWEELFAAQGRPSRLEFLLKRISQIKVFDPACGSGNFLITAYKELRRLENEILKALSKRGVQSELLGSRIQIANFYGIEIDPLASEVAILALWIAKHQMNTEFEDLFGLDQPLIPLEDATHIVTGNAARMEWNDVCFNDGAEEIYLIGNPPYAGSGKQTNDQKEDLRHAFAGATYSKNLDYISIWFYKGAKYIAGTQAQLAFVSTNSVVQGQHVGLLFPHIFETGVEIWFAHTFFRWSNSARHKAGVIVVVIGLRSRSGSPKYLYSQGIRRQVTNIGPYLTASGEIFLKAKKGRPLAKDLPPMTKGNQPTDDGRLLLSSKEKREITFEHPEVADYIAPFTGSREYINGIERWCIWVEAGDAHQAMQIRGLADRFEHISNYRARSTKAATRAVADVPWRFAEVRRKLTDAIIVPSVSSERREYVPIGYVGADTVISNLAFAVYDAQPWVFSLLTSRMHMAWLRTVGGRMGSSYRYSNTVVYNTFPVPDLSDADKEFLAERGRQVLEARENHPDKTLAKLYDPDLMPDDLRLAHRQLDEAVDSLYRKTGFATDEERLALLFERYAEMVGE